MNDEIRGQALARVLSRRLLDASAGELEIVDRVLLELEKLRDGAGGRPWRRRLATGPGDVDRSYHLTRREIGAVTTLCRGGWRSGDRSEFAFNPPLEERCTACWRRAVAGDEIAQRVLELVEMISADGRARAELHEQARAEMVAPVHEPRRREALRLIGPVSIMDAPPEIKAKALDQMEQECRRLTIDSEMRLAGAAIGMLDEAGGPEPYESVELEGPEYDFEGGAG